MGAPQNHGFLNTKMVQFWTMWGTPILGPPGIYIYITIYPNRNIYIYIDTKRICTDDYKY